MIDREDRSRTIAILYDDDAQNGLTHDFFASILDSIKRTVEKEGYEILFLNTQKSAPNRRTYLETIRRKKIEGVVIVCIHYDDSEVQELLASDIPIVTIDEPVEGIPTVLSNNEEGMKELVKYVHSMGHSRIAYIHGDINEVTGKRIASFLSTCKELGIEVPNEYIVPSQYRNIKKAAYLTEHLLKLAEPPTCILYSDDYAAIGGINIIRARGMEVPGDISVAGYDGIRFMTLFEPRITTIQQNMSLMGIEAGKLLMDMIEHPEKKERPNVNVSSVLSKGRTIGTVYF